MKKKRIWEIFIISINISITTLVNHPSMMCYRFFKKTHTQTRLRLTSECTDELRDGTSDLLPTECLHILRLMPSNPATENMAVPESLTKVRRKSHMAVSLSDSYDL